MRVLHVIHRYHPCIGGSELYFKEISERLVKAGHQVTVFTTDAMNIESFWLRRKKRIQNLKETLNGVEVERFKVKVYPQQGRLWKVLVKLPGEGSRLKYHFPSPFVPGLWKRLRQMDGEFDIVHATALPYNSLLYAAERYAHRNKIPLILTPFLHLGQVENEEVARWYTRHDQIHLLGQADRVIVQTPTEFQFFRDQQFMTDQLLLLGVGVNPEEVLGLSEPSAPDVEFKSSLPAGFFVFQIGAQSFDKGTFFLIQAMERLWSKGLSIPLVLAGSPMADFKQFWKGLSSAVARNIYKFGWVKEDEKREIFQRGAFLVHPSRTESFGIVFLEAWLWGKPVIGARAGGVVDLIEEGVDGFLVQFGDADELAMKIERLWKNPRLRQRMAERGKEKVLTHYTWDKIFGKLLPVYERLTEKK